MKNKQKKKIWLDKRSIKLQKKKQKRKKHNHPSKKDGKKIIQSKNNVYTAKAPKEFSFINNPEETIQYFVNIINEIDKQNPEQIFYLDSSDVFHVTTDALVYAVAILYNIKFNALMDYGIECNLPIDNTAKKLYLESGFMHYINTPKAIMPKPSSNAQILSGNRTDPNVARQICDFVNSYFNTNNKFTLDLYKTLIELMSNTVHHAYNDRSITQPVWYLYAIAMDDAIQFTFIDTGEGIPNTVKRKFLEKVLPFMSDSSLIYSAFLGESRTETRLYNRGHGLPALYEKILKGKLKNFYVLSGSGCCQSIETNNIITLQKKDYDQGIFGTIFRFEVIKMEDVI